MVIYYIERVYLRPYVYSFCQIFQALRLFPTLRLLGTLEYSEDPSRSCEHLNFHNNLSHAAKTPQQPLKKV